MVAIDRTFNYEHIAKSYQMYLVFYSYYSEASLNWGVEDWQNIVSVLVDYNDSFYNREIEKGIVMLSDLDGENLKSRKFIFDYNRLFIGPDALIASPYESTYRSFDKLVMQDTTLKVRSFYESLGLQVKEKNSQPDDHIFLQLELICYLLSKALATGKGKYVQLYEQFFEEHLSTWVQEHCKRVIKHSESFINRAMGMVFYGFIEIEINRLSEERVS